MAIAVHNIPEGICVAVPIYFSTKNKWVAGWGYLTHCPTLPSLPPPPPRWRAFLWATASGLAEPFAGAIGWGILSSSKHQNIEDLVYAILFGLVAGMMVGGVGKEKGERGAHAAQIFCSLPGLHFFSRAAVSGSGGWC